MLLQQVAIPSLPNYARIHGETLHAVLTRMSTNEKQLQRTLDEGFRLMEMRHAYLAEALAHELAEISDRGVQSVTYYVAVTIYLSFVERFGHHLLPITSQQIHELASRLIVDGELRQLGPCGDSYSEDLVAIAQPELCRFARDEADRADDMRKGPSVEEACTVPFAALLLEIIALSLAVDATASASSWV